MLEGYEEPFPQPAPSSPYAGSRGASHSFDGARPTTSAAPSATDRTPLLPGTFADQTIAVPAGPATSRRSRRCLKRPRCLCSAAVAVVVVVVLVILTVRFAHGSSNDDNPIPQDFVRLSEIDSTIIQEIRLGQNHNFIGHPADSYDSPTCWLTKVAAHQLSAAQKTARGLNMTLKVYDCYRPRTSAVSFYLWSQQATDNYMQREFYPNISKADIFVYGYLHYRSSHSRGAGLDVTLVPLPVPPQENYRPGDPLRPCNAPASVRFHDNSIDMGTGIYCFVQLSQLVNATNVTVTAAQQHNRDLLVNVMQANGFINDANLWWQFVLQNEPYPNTYFDFPVVA